MKIDFYEEFPTKENLEKLKLINFRIRLFVAAKSIKEFKELEKQIKKIKKDTEVAYWPIIKNSYWISPFSNTKDLIETFKELDKIKNHLLIDLEMPLKKITIIKNLPSFFKNKKIIRNFLEKNEKRIIGAKRSRVIFSSFLNKLMKTLGLSYKINYESNPMFYSSMLNKKQIKKCKKFLPKLKNKEDFSISLGTIAIGILGNEPILSPEKLEKDLQFVEKAGFNKVIIFRLGGLNKEYIKVVNRFKN